MPVNVDTVYQTVQALANKEQRGYLTPHEFNLFANQVQADIFEQYFYDLNAFRGARPEAREIGDSVSHIVHKLRNTQGVSYSVTTSGLNYQGNGLWTRSPQGLKGKMFFTDTNGLRRELKPIAPEELYDLQTSKWHKEALTDIFYFDDGSDRIQVHSGSGPIDYGLSQELITGEPNLVYWGYIIVNEKPVYNASNSQHFSLHSSEQADIVIKILKLAGISIEDQQLYQAGQADESINTQQENK